MKKTSVPKSFKVKSNMYFCQYFKKIKGNSSICKFLMEVVCFWVNCFMKNIYKLCGNVGGWVHRVRRAQGG